MPPIDRELIKQHAYLPVKLAELSQSDEKAAVELLRAWGAGTMTISKIWTAVHEKLAAVGAASY